MYFATFADNRVRPYFRSTQNHLAAEYAEFAEKTFWSSSRTLRPLRLIAFGLTFSSTPKHLTAKYAKFAEKTGLSLSLRAPRSLRFTALFPLLR